MPKVGQGVSLHADTHIAGGLDAIAAALAAAAHPDYAASLLGKHGYLYLQDLRTGEYIPVVGPATTGALSGWANTLRAFPLYVPRAVTLDQIAAEVTTAVASSEMRLGIYNKGVNLYPGSLLLDAGAVATTSTEIKAISIGQALSPGLYWVVAVASAAISLRGMGSFVGPMGLLSTNLGTPNCGWTVAFTYAALPDPFPAAAAQYPAHAAVVVRIASLD